MPSLNPFHNSKPLNRRLNAYRRTNAHTTFHNSPENILRKRAVRRPLPVFTNIPKTASTRVHTLPWVTSVKQTTYNAKDQEDSFLSIAKCMRDLQTSPKPPSEKTNWSLFLFTSIDVLLRPDGPEPILQNMHRKMSMAINFHLFPHALHIFSPWLEVPTHQKKKKIYLICQLFF